MFPACISSLFRPNCFNPNEKLYVDALNVDLPALTLNLFVEECFRNRAEKQPLLWRIVKGSKADPTLAKAAKQALYILKETGFRLSGRNLTGAHIEGADLSHANLEKCIFKKSQARNLNVTGACLNGVKFDRADIRGIIWGQSPYLEHHDDIRAYCLAGDDRFLYSKDAEFLYRWNTSTCMCEAKVPIETADQRVNLFISQDNRFLFLSEEKGRMTALDLNTLRMVQQATLRLGEQERIERLVCIENQLYLVLLQESRQTEGKMQTWLKFQKINSSPPFFNNSPEFSGHIAYTIPSSKFLSFSSAKSLMVSGHVEEGQFRIEFWTLPEFEKVATWSREDRDGTLALEFSRDGELLFEDIMGFCHFQLNIRTGKLNPIFAKDFPSYINYFTSKPYAAYISSSHAVCVRNIDSDQLLCHFFPNSILDELRLSPAENFLIGKTEKKKIMIWPIDQLPYHAKEGDARCHSIQFLGQKLRLLSSETKVRNQDLSTGRSLGTVSVPAPFVSVYEGIYGIQNFSKDGELLINYSCRLLDNRFYLENLSFINITDGTEFCAFPGTLRAFSHSDDCRHVALAGLDGIALFQAPEKRFEIFIRFSQPLIEANKVVLAHSSRVQPFGYVALSTEREIAIWKFKTNSVELFARFAFPRVLMAPLEFACNDTLLIILDDFHSIHIFDLEKKTLSSMKKTFRLPQLPNPIEKGKTEQYFATTPDTGLLLTWRGDYPADVLKQNDRPILPLRCRLQFWNLRKGSLTKEIPIPYVPSKLCISQDGRHAAVWSEYHQVLYLYEIDGNALRNISRKPAFLEAKNVSIKRAQVDESTRVLLEQLQKEPLKRHNTYVAGDDVLHLRK